MLLNGVSGWQQIDYVDPTLSTFRLLRTKHVFNVTSNYSAAFNLHVHDPQTLELKPGNQESEGLQLNFIIICCLILVVILHGIFSQSRKAGVSGTFAIACLAITTILGPIFGSILMVLACYRQCVLAILKATCNPGSFAGLMKGNDAFWALEEDFSRSVINILALADFSFIVEASINNEEPLATIQELIEDRLLSRSNPFSKLLCYRKHYLGYFYWERQPFIRVADHVRWMNIEESSCHCIDSRTFISEVVLKNYISSISNSPLPANHLSGWEIIIGRYPVLMENCDSTTRYPVMFRVHHSLGDGVALVRLLLDALADPCTRTPSRTPTPSMEFNESSILVNNRQQNNTIDINEILCESTYLDVPSGENLFHMTNGKTMKKSASYNFEHWNDSLNENCLQKQCLTPTLSLKDCVRAACRKFINLIEETNRFNTLQFQTQSLQNINILINDTSALSDDISHESVADISLPSYNTKDLSDLKTMCNNDDSFHQNLVTREDRKRFNKLFIENYDTYDSCKSPLMKRAKDFIKEKMKTIKQILYHMVILSLLPATVMNQVITRTYDTNRIHGPLLSGYKVVGWYLESTEDEDSLMSMIKRIRHHTGAHFSDVILTALSNSFEEYFKRFNEVPNILTAVIPARVGRPNREDDYNAKVSIASIKSKEINAKITKLFLDRNAKRNHSVLYESSETSLDNKFSVALLTIPIASESDKDGLFSKLKRVQSYTDVLRKSADYIVNYWILNVVATLFPTPCLRNMVKSTQSSLVVSNMPGPQTQAKLAGHLLHNIVFWVPNRETTGVGITILSYNGRLQFGIIADRALIACSEDAQLIINGIVDTIKEMDKLSSTPS